MKKRSCAFLLALCLLLTACGCNSGSAEPSATPLTPAPESTAPEAEPAPEPTPELSQREQDWIEDFDYLKTQLIHYHPDPFSYCSEEEYDWKIDRLIAELPNLTDSDIYYELLTILAGLKDNHTMIEMPEGVYESRFPFNVWYFGEKLYLCGYMEGYDQFQPYLLREIVAVNGVDITYLRKKLASIAAPTNSWQSKEYMNSYFLPSFLDWAGCGYKEGYTIQILNENQEVESIEAPIISYEEAGRDGKWIYHEGLYSVDYLSDGNWVKYIQEENSGYIYMFFSEMDTVSRSLIRSPFEQASELIRAHPECDKLIIDLRLNPGGAGMAVEHLGESVQLLKASSIQHTYVITGGYTQSAAIECISIFKESLGATIVGEPTGQFTSFYMFQYIPAVVLPHSRLKVRISTDWFAGTPLTEVEYDENGKLYEWESTILPDVYISQDIKDIRQGKDSVIEWVLAQ